MAVLLSSSPPAPVDFTQTAQPPVLTEPKHETVTNLLQESKDYHRVETYPPKSAKRPLPALPRLSNIKYGSVYSTPVPPQDSDGESLPSSASSTTTGSASTSPSPPLAIPGATATFGVTTKFAATTKSASPGKSGKEACPDGLVPRLRRSSRSPPPFRPIYDGPSYSDSRIQYTTSILTVEDLKRELKQLGISKDQYKLSTDFHPTPDETPQSPEADFETPEPSSAVAAANDPLNQFLAVPPDPVVVGTPPDSSFGATVSRIKSWPKLPRPNRKGRKVSFADDKGHQLACVKIMTETSDVPPVIQSGIVRKLLKEQFPEDEKMPAASWELDFVQPAADYLTFRHRLDAANVILENAFVKNEQPCRLIGSIKVKNVAFEKEVVVRMTENNWISFVDRHAKYSTGVAGDLYDTFSFEVDIPVDSEDVPRISFCICFRAGPNQKEYWDNNHGKNYTIISNRLRKVWNAFDPDRDRRPSSPAESAFQLDRTTWSDFAPWVDLTASDAPYW